jgi:hypothetical protein
MKQVLLLMLFAVGVVNDHGFQTAPPSPSGGPVVYHNLQERNRLFLEAVDSHEADKIAPFFPRSGEFEYQFTEITDSTAQTRKRRFSGVDALHEISEGALWNSFDIQYEAQPIGLFAHQVMLRGTEWRQVGQTRFVPPGESASAAIFVEWRREGSRWVVSSFGDQRFVTRNPPPWCC